MGWSIALVWQKVQVISLFPTSLVGFVRQILGIDYRALAAFRIGLGLVVIADLLIRVTSLREHYTDFGVLPRSVLLERWSGLWDFSIHFATGTMVGQGILFALGGLAALCLTVGYKTWWATLWTWIFTSSLINRNPFVNHSGDIILRLLIFWGLFLPLGASHSWDSRGNPKKGVCFSAGTAGLLLQVCLIYWFSVLLKTGSEWVSEGTAAFYALHIDQFATPFGIWLRQYERLVHYMSFGVWYWELLGPFLLLIPMLFARTRTFAVLAFGGMHLAFEIFLGIGIFPFFNLVSLLPFLPPAFWDALGKKFSVPEILRPIPLDFPHFSREAFVKFLAEGRELLALGCLTVVFVQNLATLNQPPVKIPHSLYPVGKILGLDQKWTMFAPSPLRDDGWYVVSARFEDGKVMDLLNELSPPNWSKPLLVSATYADERWQKYMMNMYSSVNVEQRRFFSGWTCRKWNEFRAEGKRLAEFDIYFNMETTSLGGKSPVRRLHLWNHRCF